MFKKTREDLKRVQQIDPAAPSRFMIYWTYPGIIAVRRHRRANFFYRHKMKWLGRIIAYRTRRKTGIEIHPAVRLGHRLFIDHGSGVVIGETAVVGDDCTIYHGVTLGATTNKKVDRHPIIGNNVILYPNSSVVGRVIIGDNSVVAAHSFVNKSSPENSVLVGQPAKNIRDK